jgi:molybdenum cofactor cytidylyltransferase
MTEIAAIILAAGRSSRYLAGGGAEASKLIALYRGEALVRRVARAALASRARPVVVVTGHARIDVEASLAGLPLDFAFNPDFASGLASSLRTGVAALPASAPGVVVLLGDMPDIEAATIDKIVEALVTTPNLLAAVPFHAGRRGNPVLLGRALFAAVAGLQGDEGARRLLREAAPDRVAEVSFDDAAVTLDIDTPDDLAAARKLLDPATRERSR